MAGILPAGAVYFQVGETPQFNPNGDTLGGSFESAFPHSDNLDFGGSFGNSIQQAFERRELQGGRTSPTLIAKIEPLPVDKPLNKQLVLAAIALGGFFIANKMGII